MKRTGAIALILAVGCATDSASTTTVATTVEAGSRAASTTTGVVVTTEAPGGGVASIRVSDFSFSPSRVTISVGDSVTWNLAGGTHTATSGTAPEGDGIFNQTLNASAPFTFTFEEAGEYPFFCRFHPDFMTGTVTVQP